MKYPEDPEMTFEEGAQVIFDRATQGGEKFTDAGLLTQMIEVAMTWDGKGADEARRVWSRGGMDARWEFCRRMGGALRH